MVVEASWQFSREGKDGVERGFLARRRELKLEGLGR